MLDDEDLVLQRKTDETKDRRGKTQRDRDRVLYSSAFARLSGVTQVAPADEGPPYHTRLTHSLKVAQIARRIAEHVIEEQNEEAMLAKIDPDSCEAAALAHDLGHPPFGHAAEHRLDELVSEASSTASTDEDDGFEGNAQSFRIVVRLAKRRYDQNGLNLTRSTLDAILKYPWLRGPSSQPERYHKFGAYTSDKEQFQWTRMDRDPDDASKSPNAQIMDWADDVAYAVHDVEDFFRAGLIPLDRLIISNSERERVVSWMLQRAQDLSSAERAAGHFAWTEDRDAALRAAQRLFDDWPVRQLTEPYVGLSSQRATLREATALLIRRYVTDVRLLSENGGVRFAGASTKELRHEVDFLRGLVWYYVIERPELRLQQEGQLRIVSELFEKYYQAAEEGNWALLPVSMKEALEDGIPRARATADLVASLTERQAVVLWGKMSGVDQRSLRDYPVL
ncbi:MAG: dNTP triphosphohydrolase [Chloroflexi bacterium]|nr:dNTP triphosphohydrolase [Chloroflexota bacterium]